MDELSEKETLLQKKVETESTCYAFKYKRPKYVELGYFLYFIATAATVPLTEQFVKSEIEKEYYNEISGSRYNNVQQYPSGHNGSGAFEEQEGCMTTHDSNNTIHTSELDEIIQSKATVWLLYIDLALTIPAVFSTFFICSYGDVNGRKLGMVFASVGGAFRTCIFLLNIYLKLSPFVYIVAAFVDGISGSALTMYGSSCAYIADTTSREKRVFRFIILQTLNTFAGAAGNICIGYIIDIYDFKFAFWLVSFVHILNTFYIILLVPDSKIYDTSPIVNTSEKVKKVPCLETIKKRLSSIAKHVTKSFSILSEDDRTGYKRFRITLLILGFSVHATVQMGSSAVRTLFVLAPPFCWNSVQIGYYNAITSTFQGIVGFFGVWVLTNMLKESTIAIIGCLSTTLGVLVYGLSINTLMLYLSIVVMFGFNTVRPLIQAILSKRIHPTKQGALFATLFGLETICDALGGVLMNSIYAATFSIYGGIVFITSSALYGVCTIILCLYRCIE